jgi:hypothetical protein
MGSSPWSLLVSALYSVYFFEGVSKAPFKGERRGRCLRGINKSETESTDVVIFYSLKSRKVYVYS